MQLNDTDDDKFYRSKGVQDGVGCDLDPAVSG